MLFAFYLSRKLRAMTSSVVTGIIGIQTTEIQTAPNGASKMVAAQKWWRN